MFLLKPIGVAEQLVMDGAIAVAMVSLVSCTVMSLAALFSRFSQQAWILARLP